MSGQNAAEGHPVPGRLLYTRGSGDAISANVHGDRSKRNPRTGGRSSHSGSDGSGSLGAAQRRWPEYNRAIIVASVGAAAAALVTAVIQVIGR